MPLILVYIVRISKAKTLYAVVERNVYSCIDGSILGVITPLIFEFSEMKGINKSKVKVRN